MGRLKGPDCDDRLPLPGALKLARRPSQRARFTGHMDVPVLVHEGQRTEEGDKGGSRP